MFEVSVRSPAERPRRHDAYSREQRSRGPSSRSRGTSRSAGLINPASRRFRDEGADRARRRGDLEGRAAAARPGYSAVNPDPAWVALAWKALKPPGPPKNSSRALVTRMVGRPAARAAATSGHHVDSAAVHFGGNSGPMNASWPGRSLRDDPVAAEKLYGGFETPGRPHERGRTQLLSGSRTACSPGRSPLDDFLGRMRFVVDVIYRVTTRVTAISISSLTRRADFASRNAFAEQIKTIARTARSSSRTHDLEPKNPVLR